MREEPALAPIRERIAGGILYPTDESGDAYRLYPRALADRCAGHGVTFRHGVTGRRASSAAAAGRGAAPTGRIAGDAFVLAPAPQSTLLARTARAAPAGLPGQGLLAARSATTAGTAHPAGRSPMTAARPA